MYLGCNRIVYQSKDKKEKIYELRQQKKTEPFVYLQWKKGPGYKTLGKGKWYQFKNYEIINHFLMPIPTLYSSYKMISKYKQELIRLEIESMRLPYFNILGVIQETSDLDNESRSYPFRIIKVLLGDQSTVEILLKNKFATKMQEKFQVGQIIYVYQCKLNRDAKTEKKWFSSLTKNTKVKFDHEAIRQHVDETKLNKVKILSGKQDLLDETTRAIY